ncbi:DUF4169 family protein [Falsiroseomonas sp. HW251]|uniref:DUF4169 family protein n=1 Tax=Falsiroseomonas sp. HW251 TaxID=3390998 RepID=UPI003D31F8DF
MGEIVNLSKIRKQREKEAARAAAPVNRAKHGRTGAEKARDRGDAARREALLDGARRDDAPEKN